MDIKHVLIAILMIGLVTGCTARRHLEDRNAPNDEATVKLAEAASFH